jgi:hypothetical protein
MKGLRQTANVAISDIERIMKNFREGLTGNARLSGKIPLTYALFLALELEIFSQ